MRVSEALASPKDSHVWTYRILVPHRNVLVWKRSSPRAVAYHAHLYTQVLAGQETDEIERWFDREFESPADHSCGWRFLTCPRSSFVTQAAIALVTLQPAGNYDYFPQLPRHSQEAGNAYIIENWNGRGKGADPLQQQVRKFFSKLAHRIRSSSSGDELLTQSLTAHFVPFRAPRIAALPNKHASLDFAESLWTKVLQSVHSKLLVVIDQYAFEAFSRILNQALGQSPGIVEMRVGWGDYKARLRHFSPGPTLCWFPHWSTFKIFNRAESERPVAEIIDVLSRRLLQN